MKPTKIPHQLQQVFVDRAFLGLFIAVLVVGILYCIFVALSLQARDIQVVTHYTTFGEAHFYKTKWYYLILFIVFGLAVTLSHAVIMIKLYLIERRQAANMFGWLTLLMIVIAWSYTQSILRIAYI